MTDAVLEQILNKQQIRQRRTGFQVFCHRCDQMLTDNILPNLTGISTATHDKAGARQLTRDHLAARKGISKELLKFCGWPEDWPLFIATFEQTTELCGFSPDENLMRLRDALEGPARNAVKSLLLHAFCVPQIIAMLRMKFGRPELITDILLS